jgi:hypothetical protein
VLFLSYAQEDSEVASKVAAWLHVRGFELFNWLAPEWRGRLFINQIEDAMKRADCFVAILSPSFVASPWCRRERNLALQHEVALQNVNPSRIFINVLQAEHTPVTDTGFLGGYDWESIVREDEFDPALDRLVRRIRRNSNPASLSEPDGTVTGPNPSTEALPTGPARLQRPDNNVPLRFRNRVDELNKVLRGVTTSGDHHFWLITAPPQLGKSWLVREICEQPEIRDWVRSLVDLRKDDEFRSDARRLLAQLFRISPSDLPAKEPELYIAQRICDNGQPYLCVLDSAELLDEAAATTLGSALIEIYHLVRGGNIPDVRLGVIISSRMEGKWRGIKKPRMHPLPLSEFDSDVIYEALADLAAHMRLGLAPTEIREAAELVHDVTEGLPALLTRCMQWLQREHWMRRERLTRPDSFEELAKPYIEDGLLSYDSLFPVLREAGDEQPDEAAGQKAVALNKAYQVLSLYRFFTQSHLQFHLDKDEGFQTALAANNWSVVDLWDCISGAALLRRPLDEPWQAMPMATRRLLYRHFLNSGSIPADCQQLALEFMKTWGERQLGKEQTIALVECIWHEAMAFSADERAELELRLLTSADALSCGLRPSPAYTVKELRRYAVERLESDVELEKAISQVDGLYQKLVEIVRNPPSESETVS